MLIKEGMISDRKVIVNIVGGIVLYWWSIYGMLSFFICRYLLFFLEFFGYFIVEDIEVRSLFGFELLLYEFYVFVLVCIY